MYPEGAWGARVRRTMPSRVTMRTGGSVSPGFWVEAGGRFGLLSITLATLGGSTGWMG